MSCDLTDPNIATAHQSVVDSGSDINWLLLGYHDTRDRISLYETGTGGLDEFRQKLNDEVLYGLVNVEDEAENLLVLVAYVSENVSGVRRARALVHGRAVASLFKDHQVQISASTPGEVNINAVRARLRSLQATSPPVSQGADSGAGADDGAQAEAQRQEMERRRLEMEEKKRQMELEKQRAEQEAAAAARARQLKAQALSEANAGGVLAYVTMQGRGSYLWKRRFCVFKDREMRLYADRETAMDLNGKPLQVLALQVKKVEDAEQEVLIPHSWKVILNDGESEPYYFFADDQEAKEKMMYALHASAV